MSAQVRAPPRMSAEPSSRTSQQPVVTMTTPSTMAVARVCRDLFGPVDREATRRFLETELKAQGERDADRWGFDFANVTPRKAGPGTARYAWEKVGDAVEGSVPDAYALRRLDCLHKGDAGVVKETVVMEAVVNGTVVNGTVVNGTVVKQTQITDYLKIQKKPPAAAPAAKKRALPAASSTGVDASAQASDDNAQPRAKLSRPAPS